MHNTATDGNGEEWRPVPGFEAKYHISNLGRLRKICPYCGPSHSSIMVPEPTRGGYLSIVFTMCGRRSRKLIHVLVAHVFLGPPPLNHEVNHKDGDKRHAALANLEYMTRPENIKHSFRIGLRKQKLTPDQVREIKAKLPTTRKVDLAAEYKVSRTVIKGIANGRIWSHVT
jgi:hypothetical protein